MRDPFISEGWSDKLFVVTVISNPLMYKARYELYVEFAKRVKDAGAVLVTVELAFGERKFAVTEAGNPLHIQLRTGSECRKGHMLWHKENLLKLGIARLPKEAKYIAWIDADVVFQRPDWVTATIHQLQSYDFIQMFSHAQDLCPEGAPINGTPQVSFCYAWVNGLPRDWNKGEYAKGVGHPGYAWACRRDAYEKVGGLIDFAVLGSADRHMAYGLVDKIEFSYHPDVHPRYKHMCKRWQVNARKYIHRNIGYLPGLITHHWHGSKKFRGYSSRWKIIVDEQFNPDVDLKPDACGVYQLTERNYKLRDKIRKYFASRNEDDIRID